jgi:hypothetical protein
MPTINDTWMYYLAAVAVYGVPVGFSAGVIGGLVYGIGSDIAGGLRALRPYSVKMLWPF